MVEEESVAIARLRDMPIDVAMEMVDRAGTCISVFKCDRHFFDDIVLHCSV